MPQLDPMRLLSELAQAYLWMLLIVAVGFAVAVAIFELFREDD